MVVWAKRTRFEKFWTFNLPLAKPDFTKPSASEQMSTTLTLKNGRDDELKVSNVMIWIKKILPWKKDHSTMRQIQWAAPTSIFLDGLRTTIYVIFSPPGEKWKKIVKRWWWKRQLSIFLKVIISNCCFAYLSIHTPAASQSRKQLKYRQNITMLSWKRCCVLLMNLTDMLPLCRAKNGPQNERTPNFGGLKDTNMKNRWYRVQMW